MGLTRIRADQISNIDYKQAVRVITVANVTLSGGAPSTVDGVNLSAGDRVLVQGQSTGSQNGIYVVSTLGTGSNGTWARSADGNENGEIEAGMIIMVTEGDTYKDTQWKLTTNNPITIGTTALVFEQNSAFAFGNVYANGTAILASSVGDTIELVAGTNITITGNGTAKTVTFAASGALTPTLIENGTSNVNVTSSGGNVTVGVGGTDNIAVFSTAGANITGYLAATGNISGNYVLGNGAFLDGLPAGYANSDVAAYLASGTVTTDIKTTGAISATGNVTGGNLLGTIATASQTNITAVGTLTSLSVSGNVQGGNLRTAGQVSATGNVTGGNLRSASLGSAGNTVLVGSDNNLVSTSRLYINTTNGRIGIGTTNPDYPFELETTGENALIVLTRTDGAACFIEGQATRAAFGAVGATPLALAYNSLAVVTIGAGGAITVNPDGANPFTFPTADGSSGQALVTNGAGTVSFGTPASATTAGTVTTAAQANITSVGTLTSLSVSGNVQGGNLRTAGLISATGTVTGTSFLGVAQSATTATTAGTVTTAAQANITSVGTLTSLSVSGNVQGGNLRTAGQVSATGNVTGGNLLGTIRTAAQTSITSVGTLTSLSVSGNVQGGNLRTAGLISATGTVTGTTFIGIANQAKYADLAEYYIADTDYPVGTVLEFGGNSEVTQTSTSHITSIAGTVSDQPAYIMNSGLDHPHRTPVALIGRVPCRVVGSIQKGDRLVASAIPGVATALDPAQYQPGCIIGKALENYDSNEPGTIEVVVGRL